MNPEYTRRFKIGLSAEFEFLHILEKRGLAVWHLRSYGDLLVQSKAGKFAIEVKVVSTTKRNSRSYSRVYFRRDGTQKFLKLCGEFGFTPLLALKYDSEWHISEKIPTDFTNVTKHGTTIIFHKLTPITLSQFLMTSEAFKK